METALLIIDVQNDYFPGGKCELYHTTEALANIELVLAKFRAEQRLVIHVQHISISAGATFFRPDTEGVLIHDRLKPAGNEFQVKKNYPNSFMDTELLDIVKKCCITDMLI